MSSPNFPPENASIRTALRHAFFWLVAANAVGFLLALLLVAPTGGGLLGTWTYGRWMPLHLNLHLFGWTSLPLVAWLFRLYGVDAIGLTSWGLTAIWAWSAALLAGSLAWLDGQTSGKIFLDWSGRSLGFFLGAMVLLWGVLAAAWFRGRRGKAHLLGLLALGAVPVLLALAARPEVYPPVNPESGGPTGASLLGSSLSVVFLLLLVPRSLGRRRAEGAGRESLYWIVFGLQLAAVPFLERTVISHREPSQWIGLGLLLAWIALLPIFYRRYSWSPLERRWLSASLAWLALLILTGWLTFLPGLLDAAKFTNVLVAHAHFAMAGFTSTFLLFLAVVLTGGTRPLATGFWWWNGATLGYVVLMASAGLFEAADPAWILHPNPTKTSLYTLRLLCGLVLLIVSARWWLGLLKPHEPQSAANN
ncbi:MAG: hypothetical protein O3A92_00450 [Verrucomicrobia bacterium]|nr:hypothetical protein [Verrucomicrobiota bacterium]